VPADRETGTAVLCSQVERLVRNQLGPDFAVAAQPPTLTLDALFEAERRHIARAVPKRQAEFATARVCARLALAELGAPTGSLVPNSDRSPAWPDGVKGSISHTADCCVVAVSRSEAVEAVGIDVEADTPLPANLLRRVCTGAERDSFAALPPDAATSAAKLTFSAKEAVYKCQYGLTGAFLDFQEVDLGFDLRRGRFWIRAITRDGAVWDNLRRIDGRFARAEGLLVTTAVMRRPACQADRTPPHRRG
jgi:4'-phosphopantetheinyl transferase EntD